MITRDVRCGICANHLASILNRWSSFSKVEGSKHQYDQRYLQMPWCATIGATRLAVLERGKEKYELINFTIRGFLRSVCNRSCDFCAGIDRVLPKLVASYISIDEQHEFFCRTSCWRMACC